MTKKFNPSPGRSGRDYVPNARAKERKRLLDDLYEHIVKKNNHRFSLASFIKSYKVDNSITSVLQDSRIKIITNRQTQFDPWYEWTTTEPNYGHVNTILSLETESRRKKYEDKKSVDKLKRQRDSQRETSRKHWENLPGQARNEQEMIAEIMQYLQNPQLRQKILQYFSDYELIGPLQERGYTVHRQN